ncbi:caffeoyl-CoA O-methyltransferase [Crocosphaera subtropica ATCC 51142]|uniref:Caffeoyl-CoA O-methyltransferase n=1 Tax=Crocosphaera subtropica (strain ATCC 51142 / BH68) TaxID=43989 RepID=B1WX00_CROS5|nr:class I SAM-dependent methyltransferase [Crocosphaera subtropica]ACB52469.1 caffeoyl-CoA O-methyltransferase [Crocosphaera subtropica ATCC 51142]
MSQILTTPPTARPVTPLGILVEKLENVRKLAETSSFSASLLTALQEVEALASGLDPYLDDCTTEESTALANLAQKTATEDWSKRFSDGETVRQLEQEMLSGHIEGQTLKLFVSMMGAKHILEVGMFTGYSALAMAEALPEDGCVIACEVDQYVADFARSCFDESDHGHKIDIKVAPALETMKILADAQECFDLVFIDADKTEYIDYFNLLLERNLVVSGGIICVDNTLLQGQPYLPPQQRTANGEAIAQFNRFVADDDRVEQVLLPLRDGLTLIRRK